MMGCFAPPPHAAHGMRGGGKTPHDLSACLLPTPLQAETLTLEDQRLTLDVQVTTPTASCPTCAQPAPRRHSHSRRTLADLPWATVPVRLHFHIRRFFCDIPACGRRTFTEPEATVARPYAHPSPPVHYDPILLCR